MGAAAGLVSLRQDSGLLLRPLAQTLVPLPWAPAPCSLLQDGGEKEEAVKMVETGWRWRADLASSLLLGFVLGSSWLAAPVGAALQLLLPHLQAKLSFYFSFSISFYFSVYFSFSVFFSFSCSPCSCSWCSAWPVMAAAP
jgi:hypothetical protein